MVELSSLISVMYEQDEETGKLAIQLANSVVLPMALKSAIELNLMDIIFNATSCGLQLSPAEIAARIPTKNPNAAELLNRLLRLLASYDILNCSQSTKENGQVEALYSAKPICKFLTKNQDGGSIAPLLLLKHDQVFVKAWYHLTTTILEGGFPFNSSYGMTAYEYAASDQRFNTVFNQAMSNLSTLVMDKILNVYKGFEGIKLLVDVGGGTGVTLHMIRSKYPHIKSINYDLPHVIAEAPSYPGVEHVGGDMFVSVPKGDAIFMKWILHNWRDESMVELLKNCWEALPNNGKVIVLDEILPSKPENNVDSQIVLEQDLVMLAYSPEGLERTQKEFEALALKSGFSSCQFICRAYETWVMEFHKTA